MAVKRSSVKKPTSPVRPEAGRFEPDAPVKPEPVDPIWVDPNRVRELLQESLALHQKARATKAGRPAGWRDMLRQARDLRVSAVSLDPGFEAPAWAEEQGVTPAGRDTNAELMKFYNELGLS